MELQREKNIATRIYFPLVDADGALVLNSANPDSEIDTWDDGNDPDGFVDCNQEAVHVGGGWYELNLIVGEMNNDYIAIQVKSDDALTQCILINTKSYTEITGVYDKLPAGDLVDNTSMGISFRTNLGITIGAVDDLGPSDTVFDTDLLEASDDHYNGH